MLGKKISDSLYLHASNLYGDIGNLAKRLSKAKQICGSSATPLTDFNIIRFENNTNRIALLNYPDFFETPFPELKESWLVNLDTETFSYRTYANSLNPPIFHRKELLLPDSDPRKPEFEALTKSAEDIGLFDNPTRIGYSKQWFSLIKEKGYKLEDHTLLPIGNDDSADNPSGEENQKPSTSEVSRHLTALVRYGFSAPVQSLARYGLLDGKYSLFDYGCGRGDDIRGLLENGLIASGWDPFYAPDNPVNSADIVNVGFVLNVIEDFDERVDALVRAWSLATRMIVISVMLNNNNETKGKSFRDGVLTKRGTFQKYYTQTSIKTFLEQVLDEEPIPVGPGILYIFRDKELEQQFLLSRYRRKNNRLKDPSFKQSPKARLPKRDRSAEKYETYKQALDDLWLLWLTLGRKPEKPDINNQLVLTEGFGTIPKALRFLVKRNGIEAIEDAKKRRIEDILVYFALNQFSKRKAYKSMDSRLQKDLKVFFGNYMQSQVAARELLFKIADIEAIEKACRYAAEHGFGHYIEGKSLQLHTSMIEELPPILRIYIGCASILYGDYQSADLVKIHISSGKVSLMHFDNFDDSPLPKLLERVKVKLRDQDIDFFSYGEEFASPFLYHKSRYINEEHPNYPEQLAFEKQLAGLVLFDFTGYGPSASTVINKLTNHRLVISGFKLKSATDIPNLESPCGRYFTFAQLIQCGETQASSGIENLPTKAESYNALHDLTIHIIDEVIDYFGMVNLTYGFCSPELARKVPGRIDIKRDQHCSHEVNRLGNIISPRLGAAVDFIVEDESMLEVAQWIVENLPFDRLYYYGDTKPIHVSYGPNHDKQIVQMLPGKTDKLIPRVISCENFLTLRRMLPPPQPSSTQGDGIN